MFDEFLLDNGTLVHCQRRNANANEAASLPEATQNTAAENPAPNDVIYGYVLAYAPWPGSLGSVRHLGVSRHTLWRCLERGHPGHSQLGAVTKAVGDTPNTVVAVAWVMIARRQIR